MLLVLLGTVEVGLFLWQRSASQDGVDVLADLAVSRPGDQWKAVTNEEDRRTTCNAAPLQPNVDYLDGGSGNGDRIRLTWHCHYMSVMGAAIWPDGLSYDVVAEAVFREVEPNATPSPSPSL